MPHCPSNSVFNGFQCVCRKGYYEVVGGKCGKCPEGQSWNGKECSASTECVPGFRWSRVRLCCEHGEIQCGPHAEWNGYQCECWKGYNKINQICQQCAPPSQYDGEKCVVEEGGSCEESNEVMISGRCVCEAGYHRYQSSCIRCPAGTEWNGQYCENEGEACMSVPLSVLVNHQCRCKSGYRKVNNLCLPNQ